MAEPDTEKEQYVVWDDDQVCVWFYPAGTMNKPDLDRWTYEVCFKDPHAVYDKMGPAEDVVRQTLGIVREAFRGTLSPDCFHNMEYVDATHPHRVRFEPLQLPGTG